MNKGRPSAMLDDHLIGTGLYTVSEAATLTGTNSRSIRRWIVGYHFRSRDTERAMPPVWRSDVGEIDGQIALSFLDLMEIRFIGAFREHHVSWRAIREAAELACEMFNDGHPFTRRQFRTDGKRIFQQIDDRGDVKLFDMNRRSWVFNGIVGPSLYRGVEFSHDQISRWFPMFPRKTVMLDPELSFGRPVVAKSCVPTDVLAAAAKAEESPSKVARWYGTTTAEVRAAVDFEERRAA